MRGGTWGVKGEGGEVGEGGGADSCHDLYICVANNGVTLASVSCAINGEI